MFIRNKVKEAQWLCAIATSTTNHSSSTVTTLRLLVPTDAQARVAPRLPLPQATIATHVSKPLSSIYFFNSIHTFLVRQRASTFGRWPPWTTTASNLDHQRRRLLRTTTTTDDDYYGRRLLRWRLLQLQPHLLLRLRQLIFCTTQNCKIWPLTTTPQVLPSWLFIDREPFAWTCPCTMVGVSSAAWCWFWLSSLKSVDLDGN